MCMNAALKPRNFGEKRDFKMRKLHYLIISICLVGAGAITYYLAKPKMGPDITFAGDLDKYKIQRFDEQYLENIEMLVDLQEATLHLAVFIAKLREENATMKIEIDQLQKAVTDLRQRLTKLESK